ncbi:MAG: hypothetical protein EOO44_01630 [Flavobacterium sp.]|nr:MAG: hypothetical protein EOO44_01630 [Flavobacterium sp.]
MKKITLLLLLFVGLTSCSNDSSENNEPEEVTYADVKPTQTKYKVYYGGQFTKSENIILKSAETNPETEIVRPISVIFYPRTQTISFSNIFDTKTVIYPVYSIIYHVGVGVIYNIKVNDVIYTCQVDDATDSKPASIIITFEKNIYRFKASSSEKKNIVKLLFRDTHTVLEDIRKNIIREYFYNDTLVGLAVKRYRDPVTYENLVINTYYRYDKGRLTGKELLDKDRVLFGKITYDYENNQIVKATYLDASGTVTNINKYEYDANGRISAAYYGNSTATNFNIRNYTYEKNKMTTVYTDSNGTYRDTEVSTYNSDSKLFFYSQDQILDPFDYLSISQSIITKSNGEVIIFPYHFYEYSNDGLLVKVIGYDPSTERKLEYRDE